MNREEGQPFLIPNCTTCNHCGESFLEGDRVYRGMNFVAHLECFIRSLVGSVAHQKKQCSCYGGHMEDDPKLTKREAAIAAFLYSRHGFEPSQRN